MEGKDRLKKIKDESERVYWLASSEENIPYDSTTWYRCIGIEKFVKSVEEKMGEIVGVIFSDNNLGFIVDIKQENDKKKAEGHGK